MQRLRKRKETKFLRVLVSPKTLFTHARYEVPKKLKRRNSYGSLSVNT